MIQFRDRRKLSALCTWCQMSRATGSWWDWAGVEHAAALRENYVIREKLMPKIMKVIWFLVLLLLSVSYSIFEQFSDNNASHTSVRRAIFIRPGKIYLTWRYWKLRVLLSTFLDGRDAGHVSRIRENGQDWGIWPRWNCHKHCLNCRIRDKYKKYVHT